MKQFPSRIQAVVAIVAAGSFVSLAYNLVAPKGVLSLTAHAATAEASAPAPARTSADASAQPPAGTTAPPQAGTTATAAQPPSGSDPSTASTQATSSTTSETATTTPAPHKAKKSAKKPAAKAKSAKTTGARSAAAATASAATKTAPATAAPAAPEKPAAPQVVELPEARLLQLQKTAILIDARERNVYELGHIPGALSLPDPDFATAFPRLESRLPRDAKILVYCESETCDQADNVSWNLVHKGYKNILLFKKGWSAWEAADYPQEKGPSR